MNIHVSSRGCLDSGCTVNYCGDRVLVTNKIPVLRGICVGQPDATTIRLSNIDLLPTPQLSLASCCIYIIPAAKDRCLMSVSQICDEGFAIKFDATHVYLQKGRLILIGTIDITSGLYYIDFDAPIHPTHVENPTYLSLAPLADTNEARAYYAHDMTTKLDLVQYLHRAALITVHLTWIKAIERGYYASWPGLTTKSVRKSLPKSIHTAKGHLRQEQKKSLIHQKKPSVIPSVMTSPNPIPEDVDVQEGPRNYAQGPRFPDKLLR